MSMEPKIIRTIKKTFQDERFHSEAERRKQISDDILDIIYNKVVSRKEATRVEGKGIRALIDDENRNSDE